MHLVGPEIERSGGVKVDAVGLKFPAEPKDRVPASLWHPCRRCGRRCGWSGAATAGPQPGEPRPGMEPSESSDCVAPRRLISSNMHWLIDTRLRNRLAVGAYLVQAGLIPGAPRIPRRQTDRASIPAACLSRLAPICEGSEYTECKAWSSGSGPARARGRPRPLKLAFRGTKTLD